jgi:multicomponent Na+:H+ antiporter subunit B
MTSRALIAEVFIRALYAVLLFASAWFLLRGHNAPGGGFIGGLLAVAASSAYALVLGSREALRRLPLGPLPLAAFGVLLALLSGLPAMLIGRPFLTHLWFSVPLGVTELPLSTVLLFDLGVYLCVWGAIGGYCLALVGEIEENT